MLCIVDFAEIVAWLLGCLVALLLGVDIDVKKLKLKLTLTLLMLNLMLVMLLVLSSRVVKCCWCWVVDVADVVDVVDVVAWLFGCLVAWLLGGDGSMSQS